MRLLLLLCAFVMTANAQLLSLSELPSCALNCIISSLPSTNCSIAELGCMCANEALWHDVLVCAGPACSTREALTAQKIATSACGMPVRNRSISIAILGPAMASLSGLFVLIRIITRRPGQKTLIRLGWDDLVIISTWVISAPKAAMDPFFQKFGLGRDIWTLPFRDISNMLRLFYYAEIFYLLSVSLTKIALLAFFLRVFPGQTFKRITWAMIGIVLAFTIAFFFPLVFQCRPVNYAWLRWDQEHEGKCINVFAAFLSHATVNMVLDLMILLLPMPTLWKLQVNYSQKKRLHILVMFSFGLIVTMVSTVRVTTLAPFIDSKNPSWDYWPTAVWSVIEMYTGVICACLPAAKVFLARLFPRWSSLRTDPSPPCTREMDWPQPSPLSKPLPRLPSHDSSMYSGSIV